MKDKTVAYEFFEDKYPQVVSAENARSEVLEPLTLTALITMTNTLSKMLEDKDAELERLKEAVKTANDWNKNSERAKNTLDT